MGLDLKQLGIPSAKNGDYLPGLVQAPEPTTPSVRRKPLISFSKVARVNDELTTQAGAVIGGLAAALNQMDHFARRAYDLGFFKMDVKQALGKLVTLTDSMLETYSRKFENATADTANQMGGLLGQAAELLLQLSPRQIRSSLLHMHEMIEKNITYVPTPVSMRGLLPVAEGWRLVALESPYEGNVSTNLHYLRACMRDCLNRHETPLAAHGLLTQPGVFNEYDAAESQLVLEAGIAWTQYAQVTVVYTDLGLTPRVQEAIARAEHEGREVEYRSLAGWQSEGEAIVLDAITD